MSLELKSLLDLPEGAGYETHEGRTGVKVERQGDQLKVTGRCDSLAREIEWYEEWNWRAEHRADSLERELRQTESLLRESLAALEAARYRSSSETRDPPNRIWALLIGMAGGVATGIYLTNKKTTKQG